MVRSEERILITAVPILNIAIQEILFKYNVGYMKTFSNDMYRVSRGDHMKIYIRSAINLILDFPRIWLGSLLKLPFPEK